jgi:PAS domain S-box-containing protein
MASLRREAAEREERLRSEAELERQKLRASEERLVETSRLYRELQNREAKIRRLVDANIVGILIWDIDGRILEANDAFLRIVGYDREDLASGRIRWTDLTPPEWLEVDVRERVPELKATGSLQPFEKEYFRKDGSRVPVLIGVTSFEETGNQGVAFLLDLTGRKRAEEAVRQSEKQFRDVIETMPAMAFTILPDGSTEFVNRRFTEYTGLKAEEIGLHRPNTVHPEDIEGHIDKWQASLASGEPFENEVRHRGADGQYRWFLVRGVPLRDEHGSILKWFGTMTDIEDRKQAEEKLQHENVALREELDRTSMFEEIVGTSKALQPVLSCIAKVAPTESTVFITGETGTGKELVARAIHKRSRRSEHAFVSVNCAALAPSLISSELFGHEKGAFTGAVQRRPGRFELADGGTIFLDEVGDLPPDMQVALLRVLQEREFERVGGAQPIHVDVRVIAATNRDLNTAIASGTFREDLYYRLNVFPIEVPPLRERKEDILMLVEYFVQRYASRAGKSIRSIDKKTLELFQSYNWPGNIREFQNIIDRSLILSSSDVFSVDESWFPKESSQVASRVPASQHREGERPGEREVIEAALAESRGRVSGPSGAAVKLGVPPSTLESRIKALKIRKRDFKFG